MEVFAIKTYQDLKACTDESSRMTFVFDAISEHKGSPLYLTAQDANLYLRGLNATIYKNQKFLYDLKGQKVPDVYSANHKCASGHFKRYIIQETAFEVGNGVNFTNKDTKAKLGKRFDVSLYDAVKSALAEGSAYGFYNADKVEFFKFTEFVPLWDEDSGALRAGISFKQVDVNKPLNAILFEEDGYTMYQRKGTSGPEIKAVKADYKQDIVKNKATGEIQSIESGGNYPGFPIIPLWGNREHDSALVGNRENIDCHDLIQSGFANDLDDAVSLYWTLENCAGMDDVDLAKFLERMRLLKGAVVGGKDEDGDEDSSPKAVSHTVEVPYQSRETYLKMLDKTITKKMMALDTEGIAAGAINIPQLKAAYEPLNEKCDELEMCLFEFFDGLFEIMGIDDEPQFKRSMISNEAEVTQMVLSSAEYLDRRTIMELLPFVPVDKIDDILKRRDAEEVDRYSMREPEPDEPEEKEEEEEEKERE